MLKTEMSKCKFMSHLSETKKFFKWNKRFCFVVDQIHDFFETHGKLKSLFSPIILWSPYQDGENSPRLLCKVIA